MENFFVDDIFYTDLSELCEYQCWEKSEIELYSDDYRLEVRPAVLEPIVKFNALDITERIEDDRFSENGIDNEIKKIAKILDDNIDFDRINSQIPKLYYSTYKKHHFTKQDLLEVFD